MRYFLVLFMLISSVSFADIYVLTETDTNIVHSLSDKDDAYGGLVPTGLKKNIIKGELHDLDLTYQENWYTFKNGKFKLDMKKVEAEAKAEEEARKKAERDKLINDKMRSMAEQALIDAGQLEVE